MMRRRKNYCKAPWCMSEKCVQYNFGRQLKSKCLRMYLFMEIVCKLYDIERVVKVAALD